MSRATSGSVNLTRMLTGSPEDQVLTFAAPPGMPVEAPADLSGACAQRSCEF
jgi:hypothetical protein